MHLRLTPQDLPAPGGGPRLPARCASWRRGTCASAREAGPGVVPVPTRGCVHVSAEDPRCETVHGSGGELPRANGWVSHWACGGGWGCGKPKLWSSETFDRLAATLSNRRGTTSNRCDSFHSMAPEQHPHTYFWLRFTKVLSRSHLFFLDSHFQFSPHFQTRFNTSIDKKMDSFPPDSWQCVASCRREDGSRVGNPPRLSDGAPVLIPYA